MRAFFINFIADLRASYWFVPGLMFLGALVLSFITLHLDALWGAEWMAKQDVFRLTDRDSARAVLSVVAQSMIGVAGVSFSITLVAVSFASSQFGPRLVGNFMRDRGNQFTLGTFTAAFIYALMVLRSVSPKSEDLELFVPQISVLTAIALAIMSVCVLIYFIHHVPQSIDIGNITATVGRQLRDRIADPFPEGGRDATLRDVSLERFARGGAVHATETGYVRSLDVEALIEIATERDLILRLQYRPGDFVVAGDVLLHGVRADASDAGEPDLGDASDLRRAFAVGGERTAAQNLFFLADELVEICAFALSPGVNDPYTAVTCLDWLEAALREMAAGETPSPYRADESGAVRLIAHPVDFERMADRVLPRVTPYVARDAMTAVHLVRKLASLGHALDDPTRRAVVRRHMEALIDACESGLDILSVRAAFAEAAVEARDVLNDDAKAREMRFAQSWFGGSA